MKKLSYYNEYFKRMLPPRVSSPSYKIQYRTLYVHNNLFYSIIFKITVNQPLKIFYIKII